MPIRDASDDDLDQALARHQAGDLAEAERLFRLVVAATPRHAVALLHLGAIALQRGQAGPAVALLEDAAAASPKDAGIQFNLALALRALDRIDDAAARYERAIALAPDFADAHVNLANLRRGQNRLDAARAGYEAAIAVVPRHAGAHNNLGTLLQDLGAFEPAVAAHRQALALQPRHAGAHSNLGNALLALGRRDEALAAFRQAIALQPALIHAHRGLANALRESGDIEGALASLEAAPQGDAEILSLLIHVSLHLCRWDGLAERQAALLAALDAGAGALPFTLLSLPTTPAQQQACARAWTARAVAVTPPLARPPRPVGASERLRVGYVSSDLREHPIGYLIPGLLEHHDRSRFEITAYATTADDGGPTGRRIRQACEHVVALDALDHDGAARRIAQDGIDILVDLNGCTAGGRPLLFARRPAPVQVNFLGYCSTTGADFIDYAVVDPVVVPPDEQRFFDEQLVHLPDSYYVSPRERTVAPHRPSRAELGLPERGFVFCCFNSSYKISPAFFDIWMRLLRDIPDSVLWLLAFRPTSTANLRREAAARGVDPARLIFAPSVRLPEHLARQPLADLWLDTLPYGGHTSANDALWCGVPVVTCRGTALPGRVGASLLSALGLPELIAESPAAYAALARDLARDPAALAALRARVAANRTTHPLFDGARFARHLERAYAIMIARQRDGLPPAPIRIDPA